MSTYVDLLISFPLLPSYPSRPAPSPSSPIHPSSIASSAQAPKPENREHSASIDQIPLRWHSCDEPMLQQWWFLKRITLLYKFQTTLKPLKQQQKQ